MRKFALSLLALCAFVGFTIAASVTVVKWDDDKSELTVKDGDKEKTYKVTKDTKVKTVTKDGEKDGDIEKTKAAWKKAGDKLGDRKMKVDITTEKDTITEIKIERTKKTDK